MVQIRPVKIFELDFHLFHILVIKMWKRWKSSSKILTGLIWTILYKGARPNIATDSKSLILELSNEVSFVSEFKLKQG